MAVNWPDFSHAYGTDFEPVLAIYSRIQELCSAAGRPMFDTPWINYLVHPTVHALLLIQDEIIALAERFVDPATVDPETGIGSAFGFKAPMDGAHSIAVTPMRFAPEANSVSLEIYRTFLANCAWWLDQFTTPVQH